MTLGKTFIGHCASSQHGVFDLEEEMSKSNRHRETHRSERIGWLRAAVLGANDGVVSTASLIVGVAAAPTSRETVLLSGAAGLLAGAMSMAAGEFVSVSSQADTERADLAREKAELVSDVEYEREELAQIYVGRGLKPDLAREVARQMMEHDALAAHARDELGIHEMMRARPLQAALVSAVTFAAGAGLPLAGVALFPREQLLSAVPALSLVLLVILGATAAKTGGAPAWKGALRVTVWGALAMAVTAALGSIFNV